MAKGLCLMRNGYVLVEYGKRRVAIPPAQYKANGYSPPYDRLPAEASPKARKEPAQVETLNAKRGLAFLTNGEVAEARHFGSRIERSQCFAAPFGSARALGASSATATGEGDPRRRDLDLTTSSATPKP